MNTKLRRYVLQIAGGAVACVLFLVTSLLSLSISPDITLYAIMAIAPFLTFLTACDIRRLSRSITNDEQVSDTDPLFSKRSFHSRTR